MDKQLTAMQELIKYIDGYKDSLVKDGDTESAGYVEEVLGNAKILLSREKQQIESAYFDGVEKELNGDAISPQEYFNQTYNNQ